MTENRKIDFLGYMIMPGLPILVTVLCFLFFGYIFFYVPYQSYATALAEPVPEDQIEYFTTNKFIVKQINSRPYNETGEIYEVIVEDLSNNQRKTFVFFTDHYHEDPALARIKSWQLVANDVLEFTRLPSNTEAPACRDVFHYLDLKSRSQHLKTAPTVAVFLFFLRSNSRKS